MKVGITGSTGFIGSFICKELPYPQKKLVRYPIANNDHEEILLGDLENPNDIERFVQDIDILIHLGHLGHPRNSNHNIALNIHQNLVSTTSLFEKFAKKNPKGHIIFASSGGNMYVPHSPLTPFIETDFVSPFSGYGILKLASENYLKLFCEQYGVGATIFRISNPYGVILNPERAHGLIGVAFAKMIRQEPFTILDPPATVRDYLHLQDLSEAFQKAIKNPPLERECRLYNVGSGQGYSISEVLKAIESIAKIPLKTVLKESDLKTSPSWNVLDCRKIQKELGWSPKIQFFEGLERMWHNREALYPFKGEPCTKSV